MATHAELYYDSTVEPFRSPPLEIGLVMDFLRELRGMGMAAKATDTAGWNREMLRVAYREALLCASKRGYGIEAVLGGNGRFFGKQVPALLVREGRSVIDVYPHERGGRGRPILEGPLRGLRMVDGEAGRDRP